MDYLPLIIGEKGQKNDLGIVGILERDGLPGITNEKEDPSKNRSPGLSRLFSAKGQKGDPRKAGIQELMAIKKIFTKSKYRCF